MTNKEKFREEIENILFSGGTCYSVVDDKIVYPAECRECMFLGLDSNCKKARLKWLNEEYEEPKTDWNKVKVDTPIFVRDYKACEWCKRYFAKYEAGKVYAFPDGRTSWSFMGMSDAYLEHWEYTKLAESEE